MTYDERFFKTSPNPRSRAIIGNKLFPRLGDLYLGKTGVKGQETKEKADHNAPNNLYEPVGGDPGAHGRFDDRAYAHSPQLWTSLHRDWIIGALLAGFAIVAGAVMANRNSSR